MSERTKPSIFAAVIHRLLSEVMHLSEAVVLVRNSTVRERSRARSRIRVLIGHQEDAVGIGHRKRFEQNRMHDREDRRIRPKTHRQSEYRRRGITPILPQDSQTE